MGFYILTHLARQIHQMLQNVSHGQQGTRLVKRAGGWNNPVVPGKEGGTSKINGTQLDRHSAKEKYAMARVCK